MAKAHKTLFVTQVYHGKRFHASVPVDVLPEFVAYRDLVQELAKTLFFRDNPDRQRVPKGFAHRLDLSLESVEEGSAIVPIVRSVPELPLLPEEPAPSDEFDRARDLLSQAIDSIARGLPLPTTFPRELLSQFRPFGRHLRADESIELRSPDSQSGPRYSNTVRSRLVAQVPQEETRRLEEVDIVGRVFEANIDELTFGIETPTGLRIPGHYPLDGERPILTALRFHDSTSVRARGIAKVDREGRVEQLMQVYSIEEVESVLPEGPDLAARISELAELNEGWLDGEGIPPTKQLLDAVARLLSRLQYAHGIPTPHLYPTPSGGVLAEWSVGSWEISMDFQSSTNTANINALDVETDAEDDTTISYTELESYRTAGAFIARFFDDVERE